MQVMEIWLGDPVTLQNWLFNIPYEELELLTAQLFINYHWKDQDKDTVKTY